MEEQLLTNEGYFIGAFRPFHKGHYEAIITASKQCKKLFVIASTEDRTGEEEYKIFGLVGQFVVEKYVAPKMPENVVFLYSDKPLLYFLKLIREHDANQRINKNSPNIKVFGGEEEVENYRQICRKNFPFLCFSKLLDFFVLKRVCSGTEVRETIKKNDFEKFSSFMPSVLSKTERQTVFVNFGGKIKQVEKDAEVESLTEKERLPGEVKKNFGLHIKHLENLKPAEATYFISEFKKANIKVTEKIDGMFVRIGWTCFGGLYVETKNGARFYFSKDIPKHLFFLEDLGTLLEKLETNLAPIQETISKTFSFIKHIRSWEFSAEYVPVYDYNIVVYDKEKIQNGALVFYSFVINEKTVKTFDYIKLLTQLNKKVAPVLNLKIYNNPEIILDAKNTNLQTSIKDLEAFTKKNQVDLLKPARTAEIKGLKQNFVKLLSQLGASLLSLKYRGYLGQQIEGFVFHLKNNMLVKVVDLNNFVKLKNDNWFFIDKIEEQELVFKKKINEDPSSLKTELTNLQKAIEETEALFYKDLYSIKNKKVTLPKKIRDTEKNFEIVKNNIDKAWDLLKQEKYTEELVVRLYNLRRLFF